MLKVQEYLKENSLEKLTEEFGIKIREYDDRVCLNYCMLNSPKHNDITKECRGLILSLPDFKVIRRCFDRFYNYSEYPESEKDFNITRSIAVEKIDGSLLPVYYYKDKWEIGTRGSAFAEVETEFGDNFRDLALKAFDRTEEGFQNFCNYALDPNYTYIFELTSLSNKIVKFYSEEPQVWILGARNNSTGEYMSYEDLDKTFGCFEFVKKPKRFKFDSIESLLESSKHLKDLDEGYVCHDLVSGIRLKVKSPTYVCAHRLHGESTVNMKRAVEIILSNEVDEFISYFPEYSQLFRESEEFINEILSEIDEVYDKYKDIVVQKDFALKVKDHSCSSLFFVARGKGFKSPSEAFYAMPENMRIKFFVDRIKK